MYNYDALGQLESVVYASGDLTTESFYDANGNLVAETTNRASTASGTAYYTYDPLGRVSEKTIYDDENKLLYRETYAYDDAVDANTSLVTKTVHGDEHAANIVTKTYTNKYGETVKEDVGGVVTQYEYDYVGNPIRVYYGDTTLATYTYDYAGNVLTETTPDGYTRTVTYDDLGRKLTESDFKGNVTSYTYDNAGRLLTMTAPLTEAKNSVTKYYYDVNGNILKQQQSAEAEDSTDPVWRTVEQTYDSMNRVTDIVNHVSATVKQYTHYGYNLAGDLTDVYTGMTVPFNVAGEDSYSHIAYTYDRRGNNTAITDALGQTETYTYDVLGMLTDAEQRNGTEIGYTYNALGNVLTDTVGTSGKNTAYTLTGAVRSVTIDGENISYTYDGMGNILTETEGNTVKAYTYDSRGRKSGYTLKINGQVISTATYAYDTSNRLTSVTEGGKTTTYTYDQNGNRASQTTDGVTTTYTYNKANLVSGMTNKMGETVISSYAYTYYADGNMHTKAETQVDVTTNTTYVYDGAGRLTSETIGEDVISYYYDANGNRTLMNNDGVITSYTYDKNNRLLTEGDITYTYDANGNTLTAGDKTYTYNYRGQQTGYTDGTVTATYAYNPSGLRSAKTVGGSTKYFVYNGMQIVFEYEDSVSDGTVYYYGLNRTHSSDGDVYVYNAHGDTVQLVNGGSLSASYTYDAFGNLLTSAGTSDNPFLYCSEYFDQETQTYYLRARYYNPANGRFTQQDAWAFMDPADPLTLNLYTYCSNNPVMYVDPSGNAWYHWALGAVIVAACAVAVVATAGGAAAGIAAVASVASGTAAATAASTVAAGAFIGSATVYGTAALYAAGNSSLESPEAFIEDFNAQGNWGTVVGTGLGGLYGAVYGYAVYRDAANQNSNGMPGEPSSSPNSQQGSSEGGVCFVAGTLISTFNGQKPIENVQAGDQVWAADPATGEVELKSVARTFINESEELVHVHVAGEEIITTPNHPFWGPEKGWTSAIQLRAGDILVLLNGEYVVVEKIQHEILESPITVYNFEVEDYHTYFVGENEALVHNQCQTSSPISQDLFDRTRDHIFSKDHIKRGIMNLGTSEADIFNKIYNAANQYSANWKVGQNQILSTINGYETTIRFYVQDGKIININAFVGTSERLSNSMLN